MTGFEQIGDEVERQLHEIELKQGGEPPAEIKPADPANDTRHGRRVINIWNQDIEIHKTSNLRVLVTAFLHKQRGLLPANHLEFLYYQELEAEGGAAEGLLATLADSDPLLMARLTQITVREDQIKEARERELPRIPTWTPIEIDQRDYWMSVTFDELNKLVPPDFPILLADLCR